MRRNWHGLLPLAILILVIGYLYLHQGGTLAPSAAAPDATPAAQPADAQLPAFLPAEARRTLALIASDGPFPHQQDGTVFGNYERLLPAEPRGYYHEYTVDTPGTHNRGARRIIIGGNPPVAYYYTDDHYRSFREFTVPR